MRIPGARIFTLLIFLCSPGLLKAQESTDFSRYMQAADNNAVLYRGNRAFFYNIRYNGHCYWETKEFKNGEILYNGKLYRDVLLNIDASRQEVLVKCETQLHAVTLASSEVEWFSIDGKAFRRIPDGVKGKIPDGFLEVLMEEGGTVVYKKVRKNLTSNTSNNNGAGIGYDDPLYNESICNFFQYSGRYYLQKDGALKKISKSKALKTAGRI